jgi:membrane associated rhomboid family serine protease
MVLTLVPILFVLEVFVIPAYVFLGIWFVIQFFQGTLAITSMEAGGVAWWAHIGGFVAGFYLVRKLLAWGWIRPQQRTPMPNTDRFSHYRFHR